MNDFQILFFVSHPIQYNSPLFRELNTIANLKILYYGGETANNYDLGFGKNVSWDIPLLDGYYYEFLKNSSRSKVMNNRFFDAINLSIFNLIRTNNDSILILNGWSYLSDWLALLSAKIFGNKVWMRSEMPWNQEELKPKSFIRSLKFFLFKHFVFKHFVDKFLYVGYQNKKFYLMHGVKEFKLIYAPYAVDNHRFQSFKTDGLSVRQKWNIDEKQIIILYSGKLIDKKRPLDLLKAFHQLNDANTVLFFMGDGPLRNELESYIAQQQVKNVIISGFINQSEIGTIYSMADLFVMCSGIGETWGLSVNEAMNFGLPVLVSSTCGSSYDLVEEGKNGFIFKEGDINHLTKLLHSLLININQINIMGEFSKQKINQFSHQVTSQNIKALLKSS
jgi:glycosyltransferase involved in cell wall biosynthesis